MTGQPTAHPSRVRAVALIVRRSLRRHAFATSVTVLAAALASGLVMAVFAIQAQSERAFAGGSGGFHAVLGARGSKLQLILNSVFHLDESPGAIPWRAYEKWKNDPRIRVAIPYVVGDSYRGFRIVGTTTELFDAYQLRGDRSLTLAGKGRVFDPHLQEAVIGSFVAEQTGLGYGDHFHPSHDISFDDTGDDHDHDHHAHAEEYVVVGVLEPTNSPVDRVLWIPIEGVYRLSGHFLRGNGELYVPQPGHTIPDEHKEVNAVMLRFISPVVSAELDAVINDEGKEMTLAGPIATEMSKLFEKFGWITRVLELVAYLVVAVSACAILAAVYNTINERRREFAILRALGARKSIVFSAIVVESATIGLIGAVLGFVCYAAIVLVASAIIRTQTGVVIDVWAFHPALALTPPGMLLLGAMAGIFPAIKAYATDVAENLHPHS